MAIRYSGDVEVRMLHRGGRIFHVTVRTPTERWAERVNCGQPVRQITPELYDHLALVVLKTFRDKDPDFPCEMSGSSVTMRRVFQAPCPMTR